MAKMTGAAPFFNITQAQLLKPLTERRTARAESSQSEPQSKQPAARRGLEAAKASQGQKPRRAELEASIARTSAKLVTDQFASEVRRLLAEQVDLLPLLSSAREWTLKLLNRQFYAIRTAAEMLKQDNLATIAGRAEVLVSLLCTGLIPFRSEHQDVLADTSQLLSSALDLVEKEGSDAGCYEQARTAIYLYAAAEPTTQRYVPSAAKPTRSKAQGQLQ